MNQNRALGLLFSVLGVLAAAGLFFGVSIHKRMKTVELQAEKIAAESRADVVWLEDGAGGMRVFTRSAGETAEAWAARIALILEQDSQGQFPPEDYICDTLIGCNTPSGKITLCTYILPGVPPEEIQERHEQALLAFCMQFMCDGC